VSLTNAMLAVIPVLEKLASACENIGFLQARFVPQDAAEMARQYQQQAQASLTFDGLDQDHHVQALTELYQQLDALQLDSEAELKRCHSALLGDVPQAGHYRSTGMGFYRDNRLVHMTAPANQAAKLLRQVLQSVAEPQHHPLLHAVNVLYDFEFIQPFGKANGVLARLWFKGLLSAWRPTLTGLPLEQRLLEVQGDYYATLRQAIADNDNSAFIAFVLNEISYCVETRLNETPYSDAQPGSEKSTAIFSQPGAQMGSDKASTRDKLLVLLEQQPQWSAARAAAVLGISSRAVEKHLSRLKRDGLLVREGSARAGRWVVTRRTTQQLSLPEY